MIYNTNIQIIVLNLVELLFVTELQTTLKSYFDFFTSIQVQAIKFAQLSFIHLDILNIWITLHLWITTVINRSLEKYLYEL